MQKERSSTRAGERQQPGFNNEAQCSKDERESQALVERATGRQGDREVVEAEHQRNCDGSLLARLQGATVLPLIGFCAQTAACKCKALPEAGLHSPRQPPTPRALTGQKPRAQHARASADASSRQPWLQHQPLPLLLSVTPSPSLLRAVLSTSLFKALALHRPLNPCPPRRAS